MRTLVQHRWLVTLVVIAVVVASSAAIALAYRDAPGNIPVQAISDGEGGSIIAWENENGVFIQRINSAGQLQWRKGGMLVCTNPPKRSFELVSDGVGGAIVTWNDRTNAQKDRDDPAFFNPVPFYSQRISPAGEFLWGDGVVGTGSTGLYGGDFPQVVPDGHGGAIFAWNNYSTYFRALHDDALRLQKLSPDGMRLWGDAGVLLVSSSPYRPLTPEDTAAGIKGTITRSRPTYEGSHDIASDGVGGVFVLWEEQQEGNARRIYTQRLDGEGQAVWRGKVIAGYGSLTYDSLKNDGAGGAFFAIADETQAMPVLRHISSDGNIQDVGYYSASVISDGLGGSFRIRVEEYPPTGPPMNRRYIPYIQRFDAFGKALWAEQRVLPEDTPQHAEVYYLAESGGGIIITWGLQEQSVAYHDIHVKKLDADGNAVWGETGHAVFDVPGVKYERAAKVLDDGSGGAIIIAAMGKNALNGDMVYAQRMDSEGQRLWGGGIRIDR